jgi:membrane-bound lytic murein transglycosylase D
VSRLVLGIGLLVVGCAPLAVDTGAGPAETDRSATEDQGAPVVSFRSPERRRIDPPTDSLADAVALDSLLELTASEELPEIEFEDLSVPTWDLNVHGYATHPRVEYYLKYFTSNGRERFQVWLDRMQRFEGYAREQLVNRELPGDLVYLALIESGFSPIAVSRARAVGIWQFMSATGRGYGLRVDPWVDERRDPIKSTDAAAEHLRDLTDRFGSHFLAAAAYNGGQGRVGRGVSQIKSRQGAGDAIDPSSDEMFFELSDAQLIKRETRDYVPKLIAASLIAKAPERYGFREPTPTEPFPRDSVVVHGGTGLDLIADLAGISLETIRELNPHILRGITPPGSEYPVRLPAGRGQAVAAAYAAVPPSEKPAVLTHVVRRGETISGIANKYGVSSSGLMSANRVARARSLQVGTTLYIPVPGTTLPEGLIRERNPAPSAPLTHIVRRGETVSGIAQRYGVTQVSIVSNNNLQSAASISTGQKLAISAGAPARTASQGSYEVRKGDTVSEIADRFGVRQRALIDANRLGSSARIHVGQRLVIPNS